MSQSAIGNALWYLEDIIHRHSADRPISISVSSGCPTIHMKDMSVLHTLMWRCVNTSYTFSG